ncbi:MAG: hypothetical protein IPJ19_17690 [Planctomycetes bacterium]|nr:hypothetical protein [Planctomycetota bacterium]
MARLPFALLLLAVCVALYAAIAGLPFYSEDFTQLQEKARIASVWQSLDLTLDPLRPAQHLAYYLLSHCADPDPAWLRALAVLLHAGSVLLVVRLGRALGLEEGAARIAGVLFLIFPCVKVVTWGAAISNPLRVFFMLGALVAFAERRTWLFWGAYFLAFFSYESSLSLPLLIALLAWALREPERLRTRSFAACVGVTLGYVLFVVLRPQRYDTLKPLDSIPANVVKALLAIAPESVRIPCIEGMRGQGGALAIGLGIALFATWCALPIWALMRGDRGVRFVVIAIAADFILPIIGAGFVPRYGYLAGGLASIGLVLATRNERTLVRRLVLCIWMFAWGHDSLVDLREYRAAGTLQQQVLAQLRAERASAGPGQIIATIDLPDMAGSERDLPLFNWGLEECLRRAGIPGPWVFWRTRAFATGTDVSPLPPGHIPRMTSQGVRVLQFQPEGAGGPGPLRRL